MSDVDFDKLESLFHEVKDLSGSARTDFLARACAGDADLFAAVDGLLRSHEAVASAQFLADADKPAEQQSPQAYSSDPQTLIGRSIGPYQVERFLGQGGMGDVYLAVRREPFKQYVALKIIRRGTRSVEVLRRFDVERQVLASLNHTNIAKLLDGGITDDGQPYFAMEYVDGLPITKYCERNKLTIRDRLELFKSVCSAVQYAHQNLIIHRDIKPQNIMMTKGGDVKLLDFGIAKIINPNLADVAAAVTQTQFRMLTPDYASPEQIRGEPLTTASDVYSLGVVLYELMCDERPYDLRGRTPGEIERLVCETVPERPSTRVAAKSGVPNDRIRRVLKGDLDNIVLMALRKEPSRRYGSANLLLQDVEGYLEGRPVGAHRDSRTYRLTKFVRRNRLVTAMAVTLAALLVMFAAYSSVQARKLTHERDRARVEAEKSGEISDFVVGLFEKANPTLDPGATVTVRDVLDLGVERAERELADQPALQAEMFSVMGVSYQALGQSEAAVDLMERALSLRRGVPDAEDELAGDLLVLGSTYNYLNRRQEAEKYLQEFVDFQSQRIGSEAPEVLMGRMHLLSSMHQVAPATATDTMLAVWHRLEGQIEDLEPEHAAFVMGYVADMQFSRGEYDAAERIAVRALSVIEGLHGRLHRNYVAQLNRLNWTRIEKQAPESALESTAEAVRLSEALFPEGHRDLAGAYGTRGEVLSRLGRYDEAAELIRKDLEMRTRVLGENHTTLARVFRFAGRNEARRGDYRAAEAYFRRGEAIFSSAFGKDYVFARQHLLSVADMLAAQRRYDEAEVLLLDTYNVFVRDRGVDNQYTRSVADDLADLYTAMGLSGKAAEYRDLAAAPG